MGMMHGVGFSFVHAVAILTASFFVLVVVQKLEAQWLKIFGYVVAVLLWLSAAIVFGGCFSQLSFGDRPGFNGPCPMMLGKSMGRPDMGGPMMPESERMMRPHFAPDVKDKPMPPMERQSNGVEGEPTN